MKTRRLLFLVLFFISISSFATVSGSPGDYTLQAKMGPGFNLQDWQNQLRFGGEFDYDLGYSMGLGMLGLFGVGEDFRMQLIPSFKKDLLLVGPASFFGVVGLGYAKYNTVDALDMRIGTGVTLPLGEKYVVGSDLNLFMTPIGTPGFPVTVDWLISFGLKFN